jgi:hypothetical protein
MATLAIIETPANSILSNEAADLAQIKALLMRAMNGKPCAAYLFGSRATGSARPTPLSLQL